MIKINLQDPKRNVSSLLRQIEKKGDSFLVYRNEKTVACLMPHRPLQRNIKPHPRLSKIKINYDPTEPLTPEELGPFEL